MDVLLFGAGGFGREVAALLADVADLTVVGFLDDDLRGEVQGLPVLRPHQAGTTATYVTIGSPGSRYSIASQLGGPLPPPAIHPSSWVGSDVSIGDATIVCAGARITTNVRIGTHVHINLNSTIGHDCDIGDFVTIAPSVSVSGNCTVEAEADLGTGAVLLPGVSIGRGAIVGAGAVVTSDVPAGRTAVGIPARLLPT